MTKVLVIPFGLPVIFAWSITPDNISGLMTAAAILVTALFTGIVSLITAKAAARIVVKPLETKLDVITPLVTKIDAHVNSEKTRAEGEILNYKKQIEMQRETIEDLKKATALLAQAKAITEAAQAARIDIAASVSTPAPVLESIDKNTKAIDENTKRTDETVQELKDKTT